MARWTVLLVLALPTLAFGQDGLKPEVLLMIDGSASMGLTLDGGDATCEGNGVTMPQGGWAYTPDTPLNMVKEALLGSVQAPGGQRWCVADSPADRGAHALGPDGAFPHVRQMCCANAAGANCAAWEPCYNDHGGALRDSDAVPHDAAAARTLDGVIDANIDAVKFGMMFTDGKLDPGAAANGHYSYGGENVNLPGVGAVNVGARRPGPHIGGFIRPNHVQRINGGGNLQEGDVSDDDAEVRAHNEVVREFVGRLVPHGVAPLSGLMHDVAAYYDGEGDVACRHRSAILVTRGLDARLAPAQAVGAPYDQAHTYVERLNERNVSLHVVLIAPAVDAGAIAWASRLANESDGGSFTRVTNSAQLREKLLKLARGGIAGRRSRTRPLIVSASPADYCGDGAFPCAPPENATLQWRINAFAWVAGGTAYGRVWANELTCAERDGNRPSVPQARPDVLKYEEVMRLRGEGSRRAVSRDPNDGRPFVVTGGDGAVFGRDGSNTLGDDGRLAEYLGVQEAEVRDPVANAPADDGVAADDLEDDVNDDNGPVIAGVPEDPDRIHGAGLLVNGHFGARGLGDDARKQLGATISGDLVSLRPPALGLNDPAYLAYRTLEQRRKTVVAAGGKDGLVHFFRAVDGVEVLSLLPGAGWGQLVSGEAAMDGPLAVADIVPCRAIEGGNGDCPERLEFESWLVGASGRSASNIFGIRLGALRSLMADADRPLDLGNDIGEGGLWDKNANDLVSDVLPELTLAGATSRPYLTHVRDGEAVRAAIIVGCGDGDRAPNASSSGRCVLVLDATSGDVIRRFDIGTDGFLGGSMLYSMNGSPVAYPAGGIAPASRAYIGDAGGQLWRMDLRDVNPDNWTISVAWPPQNAEQRGDYILGRGVVDRPSLALREDGGLVVTFATDRTGSIDDPNLRAFVVSFTDRAVIGDDAVTYEVTRNWLLPLNDEEYATGAPIVRDGITFVTTREGEPDGEQCDTVRGRLYAVHYYKRYVNADGEPSSFRRGNNAPPIEAQPALAQFDQDGPTGEKALSIILPPGLVAYGMAIALTPSCADEVAGTTDLILNVADESAGARAAGGNAGDGAKVEVVDNNRVTERPLNGGVFVRNEGVEFQVCLDCTSDGLPAAGAAEAHGNVPPFPSQVVYWGSTFLN